jgi:hypothetical protein
MSPIASAKPTWLMTANELESIEFPPREFVLPDLLPTGLVMLSAKPKIGKSFFALELALCVAHGQQFLDRQPAQGSVLYLGLEDNERRFQERIAKLTGGGTFPDNLYLATDAPKLGEGLIERIEEWRLFADNPRFVVIDTLARIMPDPKPGNSEYTHANQVLGELQKYALEHNLTILLIHHTKKGDTSSDPFDQSMGSTGIFAVMDTMMILTRGRTEKQASLIVTGRDIEEQTLALQRTASGGWQTSGSAVSVATRLGVTPDQHSILQAINKGMTSSSNIDIYTGKTASNVSNFLKSLVDAGHLDKLGHGKYKLTEVTKQIMNQHSENGEYGELEEENTVPDDIPVDSFDGENEVNVSEHPKPFNLDDLL